MRICSHERLLSRPQTKDSFRRGRRDVQGPGGSYLLREPLLSQAIGEQGRAGRIACSEEEARISTPKLGEKARRLLAADLKERPYLTLQERCDYIEVMTGLSL